MLYKVRPYSVSCSPYSNPSLEGKGERSESCRITTFRRTSKLVGRVFKVNILLMLLLWSEQYCRLFGKGARVLELDKIREICNEYRQLGYAKGMLFELILRGILTLPQVPLSYR